MSRLAEKPGFIFANLVLSKSGAFTEEEIFKEVRALGLDVENERDVRVRLHRLRDAGVIVQCGSRYIPSELVAR